MAVSYIPVILVSAMLGSEFNVVIVALTMFGSVIVSNVTVC